MKDPGYEVVYPPGCKELTDELKLDELRKRLNDLSSTLDKIIDEDSCNGNTSYDLEDSSQLHQYDHYRGLFMLLISPQFLHHGDRDVQLRVAVCICKMLKLFCPVNPFSGLSDEKQQTKTCLVFLLQCIQLLSTVKSKGDVHYPKLHTILYICCQIDLFLWCTALEDQAVLLECLKTTFSIVKNLSTWAWTEITIIRQMLLDMIIKVIVQAESLLNDEMISFLLELLIEPAKSTQPEQHTFARDLILRTARHLEYPIQMLLQSALVSGVRDKNVKPETTAKHNDDSTSEDQDLTPDNVEPLKNPLLEHCFLIIYAVHTIQGSLVAPVLPSIELKLKSIDSRDRKRSIRLLARLFAEPNSLLHDKYPSLWNAFVGRFNDIDEEVRKLCVQIVPQLLKQNPDLPRQTLIQCVNHRAHDPSEDVRLFVLHTVSAMINDAPAEITRDLYEILKERSRDKSLSVRKEAAYTLGSVYRHLSKQDNPSSEDLSLVINTIFHMYYHPSHDDRIVVERLFKSVFVPYNMNTRDRVRALFTCYSLMDEASMRAMLEIFKVQFTALHLVRDALQLLGNQSSKTLPPHVGANLMDRLQLLAGLLPKSEKSVEHVKRFFNQVITDKSLRSQLSKLTKPTCTCAQATNIMRELLRRMDSGGGSTGEANTNYMRCVKIILERSAPVLFDKEFGQEFITQMVVIRETGSVSGTGSDTSDMSRALRLLHSLAVHFKKILPTDEILDYLVGILSNDDQATPSLPPDHKVLVSGQSDHDPPTIQELSLGVLCCMLGGPSMSTDRDLHGLNRPGSRIVDSHFYGSLPTLERCAMTFLPLLKQFCCTGMSQDFRFPLDQTGNSGASRPKGKSKRANVNTSGTTAASSFQQQHDTAAYLSGLAWRRERRRAKLAAQTILCMLKVVRRIQSTKKSSSQNTNSTEDFEEVNVDLDAEDEDQDKRSEHNGTTARSTAPTAFELKIQELLDSVVETCLSCSLQSPDYVACLTSLGRIALFLPGVYNKEFKKYMIKSLVQEVLVHEPENQFTNQTHDDRMQSVLSKGWLPDGYVPQATRIKISALKLVTNWLRGLKNEVKPVAQAIIRLLHRIIIHDGDLTRKGKLLPGEMSRLRLVAAVSWLKLAHCQSYVDSIEVEWYQSMTYITCDPCPEVRSHFLSKLNQGLFRLRLPLEYLAMFAHVADVSDAAFKQRAKQLLTANIQLRRDFLSRHPSYMTDPKYLFGLLPDFVLPYLIYLLAHDPEWSDLNDVNRLNRIKASLWFVLEPIVTRGHNFIFLRKIIEKIKHTRDALAPEDAVANTKIYIVCDIALGLLLTRSSDLTIKEYPVDVKLPKALYKAAPAGFRNPDFAQLLESTDADGTKTSKPLIQFTPAKSARALKEGLVPAELIKEKRPAKTTATREIGAETETSLTDDDDQPATNQESDSKTIEAKQGKPVQTKQTKLVPLGVLHEPNSATSSDATTNKNQSDNDSREFNTRKRSLMESADSAPLPKKPRNLRLAKPKTPLKGSSTVEENLRTSAKTDNLLITPSPRGSTQSTNGTVKSDGSTRTYKKKITQSQRPKNTSSKMKTRSYSTIKK